MGHVASLRRTMPACKGGGRMKLPADISPAPTALAVSVALLREGRVLLVRRGRAPGKGLHAFPGGRVEPGETLEAAARRELHEETALTAGALAPLTTVTIPDDAGSPAFELTVFLCTEATGELTPGDDADAAAWFDASEVAALALAGNVGEIAIMLLAGQPVPRHTG
jgi:ADP-ribose pyrophosphatase YjhB (NUDIX family)